MAKLSHADREGKARMVDVGPKAVTRREAAASAFVKLGPETIGLIRENGLAKGDVLNTARLAGIQAAKRAYELIPLAHPIPLENIVVDLDVEESGVLVRCRVSAEAKTGAEMEALTGAAIAALTIYDMVKAVERGAEVVRIRLDSKSGGKSGVYRRQA